MHCAAMLLSVVSSAFLVSTVSAGTVEQPIPPQSSPTDAAHSALIQVYEHTFVVDLDGTGTLDADFTFVQDVVSERTEWIRRHQLVLELQGNARGEAFR